MNPKDFFKLIIRTRSSFLEYGKRQTPSTQKEWLDNSDAIDAEIARVALLDEEIYSYTTHYCPDLIRKVEREMNSM